MSRNDTTNYTYIYNESEFIVTEILDDTAHISQQYQQMLHCSMGINP